MCLGPEVEQIASPRRTEILVLFFRMALRVPLDFGMIAPEPVFTAAILAGPDIGEDDPGIGAVIAPSDDLSTLGTSDTAQ